MKYGLPSSASVVSTSGPWSLSGGSASAPTAKSSARTLHPPNPPTRIADSSFRFPIGRSRPDTVAEATCPESRAEPGARSPSISPRLDIHSDHVVAQHGGVEDAPLFV